MPTEGHPRGLYVLFLTEMWERFSFYGLRALLILYLTKHFLFNDVEASRIYGAYFGLAYALPVIGGLLADRYLGFRKAVIFGAVLLCLGHLGMAWEGAAAVSGPEGVQRDAAALQSLYLSLALIGVGVGFLKPNISVIVGRLYAPRDPRREGGFTIFYMGINLGAFSASILVGAVGETLGWGYGFSLAGIGMLAGLAIFCCGQKHLGEVAEPPHPAKLEQHFAYIRLEHWIYLAGIGLVIVAWLLLQRPPLVGYSLSATLIGACLFFLYYGFRVCGREEWQRMAVVLVLTFFSVVFWALFEQAGSSMNLYADRVVDRDLYGWFVIPASTFQSLNAGFIIVLAPLFAILWRLLAQRNREPATPVKFALGIMQAGLGFGALVLGAHLPEEQGKVAMLWLILAYLLHTSGELCLSPIGLSMVTRLTVPQLTGMMMGTWFLAVAFAEYLAALIAALTAIPVETGRPVSSVQALAVYTEIFGALCWAGIGAGLLLLLLAPWLTRWTHGLR